MKTTRITTCLIAVLLGSALQLSALVLLEDDFTGRTPGTAVNGTPVQSGSLSKNYVSSPSANTLVYRDGYISTYSRGKGNNISVPFTLTELPAAQEQIRFQVTANPADVSSLKFGFSSDAAAGAIGYEGDIWFDINYDGSDVDYKITYRDNAYIDLPGSAGTVIGGGSAVYTLLYDFIENTINTSVNGQAIVTDYDLGAFTPDISAIRWVVSGSGQSLDADAQERYSSYSLVSIPEPSTASAVMGAFIILFVAARRR